MIRLVFVEDGEFDVSMKYEQPPATVGEARAALERIFLAQSKGCSDVILEGYCKLVISAIRDKVHYCFPPYAAIVSNLISLSSYFSSCSCSFVKRAENYLATLLHIYNWILLVFWKVLIFLPI